MVRRKGLDGMQADMAQADMARTAASWMASALVTALLLAAAVLAVFGVEPAGIAKALQVTARFMFVPFWLAYAGGALARLLGPAFQPLARRGRELGLAFASALLVHLGLVAWLWAVSERPPVSAGTALFFGSAAACTYLLALLSIQRVQRALDPQLWRIFRLLAMEFIVLAFITDFRHAGLRLSVKALLVYQVFLALIALGICLRLTSWALLARRDRWGRSLSGGLKGSAP